MLEDIIEAPVRIVSFHRPHPDHLGGDDLIAGRPHTYMDRFTRGTGYCSDSRGEWRHGHPLEHAAVREGRALQLLTHAVWWVGLEGRAARRRLADVLAERARTLDIELAANNEVWRRSPTASLNDLGSDIVNLDLPRLTQHMSEILAIGRDVPGEYWTAEHFLASRPRKFELSKLALESGKVVGYAIMSERATMQAHLHHLFVTASHRRAGLGERLLRTTMSEAAALGFNRYTLKVASENQQARSFYERHGFRLGPPEGDLVWYEQDLSRP
jgi:ribosomal protein S18 acetylase RimI-like enzyme